MKTLREQAHEYAFKHPTHVVRAVGGVARDAAIWGMERGLEAVKALRGPEDAQDAVAEVTIWEMIDALLEELDDDAGS